jgi:transposase
MEVDGMAMGRRKQEQQGEMFLLIQDLAQPKSHVFYDKLNRLLAEVGFDDFVETLCEPHYESAGPGRPSIPPGTYFRMLFIGYFEGLGSQRGIAWRCHDSLSLRAFLGVGLNEQTPDHSTLSNTRDRLPQEVHEQAFQFVLKLAGTKQLLQAKTVGVDSTYLEANAAMKSIVRKDTGEDYQEYLKRLAQAEGLENPTKEELQRFDRKRKGKKCSNEEWQSETDPDSRIAKMKDGRTHLAYKAEHVVDLESEMVLAAEVRPANDGDAETIVDSLAGAQGHLDAAATLRPEPVTEKQMETRVGTGEQIGEVAADKGYHSAATLELLSALKFRSYIPEPKRPHRLRWDDKSPEQQQAVYANRQRVGRAKSKKLQRWRSERVERSFAHVCETGGGRRSWLRGLEKVNKRYLIQAAAHNLGIVMRRLFGMGKPRCLQGPVSGWPARLLAALMAIWTICRLPLTRPLGFNPACRSWTIPFSRVWKTG